MSDYLSYRVGDYKVIGQGNEWRVMETSGSYRILKKVFKTAAAAAARAAKMSEVKP